MSAHQGDRRDLFVCAALSLVSTIDPRLNSDAIASRPVGSEVALRTSRQQQASVVSGLLLLLVSSQVSNAEVSSREIV